MAERDLTERESEIDRARRLVKAGEPTYFLPVSDEPLWTEVAVKAREKIAYAQGVADTRAADQAVVEAVLAAALAAHRFETTTSVDGTRNHGWCAGRDSWATKTIAEHEQHVTDVVLAALADLPAAPEAPEPLDAEWSTRRHRDPYCATHCRPGFKHSQCGCYCNHRQPVEPAHPDSDGGGADG